MSDPRGRRTVADFLGDRAERLFHIGRLDYDTEGLMLLMNDGELAHRLAHPSYEVLKTYLAEVTGPLPKDLGRRLATGVELDDGVASADRFRIVDRSGHRVLVEITLHEGRKHIVRRMLAETGHPVSRWSAPTWARSRLGNLQAGLPRRELSTARNRCDCCYAAVGRVTCRWRREAGPHDSAGLSASGAVQVDPRTGRDTRGHRRTRHRGDGPQPTSPPTT